MKMFEEKKQTKRTKDLKEVDLNARQGKDIITEKDPLSNHGNRKFPFSCKINDRYIDQ